jgi:hypothetical protein
MKTSVLISRITGICFGFLFLLISLPSRSQHIIRFTDWSEQNVIIVYQSKDTLKYYKIDHPEIVYVETMNHIVAITPYDAATLKLDSIAALKGKNPEFWKYKNKVTTGAVLMGVGGLVAAGCAIGLANVNYNNVGSVVKGGFYIPGILLGGATFIAGLIITATNAPKLSLYKNTHSNLSLDLKCFPATTGVALVYRF